MMIKYYKYPLKIWLTNAVIGTLLSVLLTFLYSGFSFMGQLALAKNSLSNVTSYLLASSFATLLVSVPCWLVLWFSYSKLVLLKQGDQVAKLQMVILSQIVCWGLFAIAFLAVGLSWHLWGAIVVALPYAFVVALSAWFYFPKQILMEEADGL